MNPGTGTAMKRIAATGVATTSAAITDTGVFVKGQRTSMGDIFNQHIRCGGCDKVVKRIDRKPLSEDIQREIKQFLHVNGLCKSCLDKTLNPQPANDHKAVVIEEPWRTSVTTAETRAKSVA